MELRPVLQTVVDLLYRTLWGAKAARASPSTWIMPSSTVSAWDTAIKLVETQTLPQLERTLDKASADPEYAVKWFDTAKAARETLAFVVEDATELSSWNAVRTTLVESAKTVVNLVDKAADLPKDIGDWFEKYKTLIYLGLGTTGILALMALLAPAVETARAFRPLRGLAGVRREHAKRR